MFILVAVFSLMAGPAVGAVWRADTPHDFHQSPQQGRDAARAVPGAKVCARVGQQE